MKYKQSIANNNLRSARIRFNLRQQDVADLIGFQITDRISRWESGVALPSLVNLFKLSCIYGLRPHELYPKLMEEITTETEVKVKVKYQPSDSSEAE
ncbi:MAG TPA: helix-turn-helix transcriptional regulator [Chitinophagaceae bacterium]|nr:helix-turn-helix transcriptional regulator [Chitinophagaceae bacterium]